MSTLWTPGGEHPVDRGGAGQRPGQPGPTAGPGPVPGAEQLSPEDEARARAMAEELAEVQRRVAETPAAVVVANHVMGFFELGAIHLSQQPPNLPEAALAIDAMGAVVEGLAGRLSDDEATLRQALDQIRMAFVQLRERAEGASEGAPEPAGPANSGN